MAVVRGVGEVDSPDNARHPRAARGLVEAVAGDDPARVADVKTKVANFLNNLGCTRAIGGDILPLQVEILFVRYVVVCADTTPPDP